MKLTLKSLPLIPRRFGGTVRGVRFDEVAGQRMKAKISRKRPILFSIWLWLNIVIAALSALGYFLAPELFLQGMPTVPLGLMYLYGLMCLACIYCTVSMLHWRRSGFWGLLAIGIVATLLNAYYFDLTTAVTGIVLFGITVAFLFLGGSNRLWNSFT